MALAMKPLHGTNNDDYIVGNHAHEVISAYGGEDIVIANNGHDEAWGGTGNDYLYGNSGNDILYGGGAPKFVTLQTLTIDQDYQGSVTFLGETAGYRNSLGSYKISEDGSFYDVQIHFDNASLSGSGGNLIAGVSSSELTLNAGDQLGFFIISNGYSVNGGYPGIDFDEGSLQFIDNDGSAAGLNSEAPELQFSSDSETISINGNIFHSAASNAGDSLSLNPDNLVHTVGRINTDKGEISLGFEDLYNGGDLDFDDSIFSLDIGIDNARSLSPASPSTGTVHQDDDWLYGGSGNDELYGRAGDDHHFGGSGNDTIYAGSGNDHAEGGYGSDTIKGGSGNDVLKGNSGHDTLYGGLDNDELYGGSGKDNLYGNSGDDYLQGDGGHDTLRGGDGADELLGGHGNDHLHGDSGADVLSGNSGHDHLYGGNGNDELNGGDGRDQLNGGSGDDVFVSGSGRDQLFGGSGNDTVDYSELSASVRVDLHGKRSTGGDSDQFHSIESAIGSDYDDWFRGDLRANEIFGGAGNDTIRGAKGADTLTGGDGEDIFAWRLSDLNAVDEILDFSITDDAFSFDFNLNNTQLSEYLSVTEIDSNTVISIDLDGDGDAYDSQDIVTLTAVSGLTVDDFTLIG